MERGYNSQTQQLQGAMAPRAPMPGHGTGNVPFSPGMVSGNLGPQAGMAPPSGPPAMPAGPPGPAPTQPSASGPSPMAAPPSPGMGGGMPPELDPTYYFQMMAVLMRAYSRTAAQPGLPWGYP